MKILNLYAGIGGNRKLWGEDHEVTAVENVQYIADIYQGLFEADTVIVGDAHQYLLEHFKEFDFIWASPPCPTHSRMSTSLSGWNIHRYPDMTLYQEIIFLKHFFKGDWVIENVIPYYEPLIQPTIVLDRHLFWSNRNIGGTLFSRSFQGNISDATWQMLAKHHGMILPGDAKDKRKLLRNAVPPELGKHIFDEVVALYGTI